jgi:hypothetical protein
MIELGKYDMLLSYLIKWPNNLYKLYNTSRIAASIKEVLSGSASSKPDGARDSGPGTESRTVLEKAMAKLQEYDGNVNM